MPAICKHAQVLQIPTGVSMGFRCLHPRRIAPESVLLKTGAAHSQVL
jgi:hypothetical protein